MEFPDGLRFTQEHEWVQMEGDGVALIGITDFAQQSLGDITFVELPNEGDELSQNDTFGVVESVKAVSDLYAPLSGTVLEVNTPLLDSPQTINEEPYTTAWLIRLKVKDAETELPKLMDAASYQRFVEEKQ